ncbi:DUF3224 domain-containing protein [Streptacidiphilus jiangxiensis]|uniref:DUF3224 domain-containing protein n=1 Tax=Streptacidiphilus jiangxiensis TaxID=235985 RepID=A0A1H7Y7Z4_STRJI|nr:DUF3224 domain-containing protein [Streptacidiphilus jiangxiensis]SEM42336.1 Protein of unknown function [Streptacidiphilus jiangxiensis]
MRANGTFSVVSMEPVPAGELSDKLSGTVVTALATGVSIMEKHFAGAIEGRSETIFTAAFDAARGIGTYLALESFEGTVDGHAGTFNFAHSASTTGADRQSEFFVLVPGSGTGGLAGIAGTGGMTVDADGTHRIWLDYTLD